MKKLLILSFLIPVLCYSQTPHDTTGLQPTEEMALLEVIVVNTNLKSQEGEKVTFVATKDGKTYSGITNSQGRFKMLVPEGDKYKVNYKNFTDNKNYASIDIPSQPGFINFEYTIKVNRPKVFTLDNVFFDTGKSTLRPESNNSLNDLAEFMTNKKTLKIEIAGHTDNVGDKIKNQKLSEDRANSVKNYLAKKGISAERVIAKGYGDSQPVADNSTPEGKQKNRRTEVRTLSE